MIFVTVGTQLPFPRLLSAVGFAAQQMGCRVTAQTCDPTFASPGIESFEKLDAQQFDAFIANAGVVVSHAGMGSILSAQRHRKPIIVMPRRLDLGEIRSDHQLATVQRLKDIRGVYVASDQEQLLAHLMGIDRLVPVETDDSVARDFARHLRIQINALCGRA